jgi:hypothetical protein
MNVPLNTDRNGEKQGGCACAIVYDPLSETPYRIRVEYCRHHLRVRFGK